MSKERYAEHTVAWELPNRDSVTKGNYNLADIETKYLPIQTEVVSDSKDQTINKLKQRIAELEEQLKKFTEPKKVKYNKFSGYRGTRFRCPNCNKQIENCIDYTADYYCKHCGQSVIYPKFRVVDNFGELYFEEAQAKLEELKGE